MALNRTVLRSLDIMELLSVKENGMTLSEITTELDIPKSSTFDIIQTLLHRGFIEYENEKFKTFKLGLNSFKVGSLYLKNIDIYKESRPILKELLNVSGKIVFLATANNDNIVYLDRLETDNSISASATIGTVKPMYCTGLGRALLSDLDNEEIKELITKGPYEKKTKNTITNFLDLIKAVDKVRENGYAYDNAEAENQVYCVASPVFNHDGRAVAAISISGIEPLEYKKYGKMVREYALRISHKLGYK